MRAAIFVLFAAVSVAGCDKSLPTHDPSQAEQPTEPAVEATSGAASGAGEACETAYGDTVQIVKSLHESMARSGREVDESEYAPPDRARYLEVCATLPAETQRCLVMAHAIANSEACQAEIDALEPAHRTAYNELMGK